MIKKKISLLFVFSFLTILSTNNALAACGTDTVTRDGITYGTVVGADGRCWLDRNLGATRVATSYNDSQAYGWMFQWGRGVDGHQSRTSTNTSSNSYSDTPGHANFITEDLSPYDWRIPQNNNLWQGVNGINNPCPSDFRLPTQAEWSALISAANIANYTSAFNSTLKLTATGRRYFDGVILYPGSFGGYWSSSVISDSSSFVYFTSSSMSSNSTYSRAYGLSVRCIKEPVTVTTPTLTTQTTTSITATSATGNGTVTATGDENPTRYIEWGTTSGNYINSCNAGTGGLGAYSCTMTDLLPSTTYYVRAKATNSAGTSYGTETSFTTTAFTCGNTYLYGGKNYQTVQIGSQCWFKENLNIGTMLGSASTMPSNDSLIEKWCQNNSVSECDAYGGLYTWAETNGLTSSCNAVSCAVPEQNQGICPSGWHIPSDNEFKTLEMYLGMTQEQVNETAWRGTNQGSMLSVNTLNGNNISGFSGLFGGYRFTDGSYTSFRITGNFWSSSEYSLPQNGMYRMLFSGLSTVYRGTVDKKYGHSIRCIKDGVMISAPTLTTQPATNITPISATISANLTATGGDNPERQIQYGTTSGNLTSSCTQGTGGTGTYSCTLTNLNPNTTYYYRAKATNSAGTSYGSELSFTTQSLPNEVTITNPDTTKLENATTNAYFQINQGTHTNTQEVKTNTQVKLTTTNTEVTLPPNTTITEQNNNSFNFTNFITQNKTQEVKQFTPSLAAVKIGVPNTRMAFSNPITLTLTVGDAYNGKTLTIQYQEDGSTTWITNELDPTCVIANGLCTFQTDHATTYTVNGDGTISGAGQNDITTDVQDVLSLDCDQTGNTNDNIVEFNELTPGTPVTASTTCTVTTNSDAGYTLSVKRNDTDATMDKDTDSTTKITDRTNWNSTAPNATTWQTNDTGLAFTVYQTTATKNTTWWGIGTTQTDVNNKYAGFPTTFTDIMQHTTYNETATTTNIGYKLDVPTTQKSGTYAGEITYQVVTAP